MDRSITKIKKTMHKLIDDILFYKEQNLLDATLYKNREIIDFVINYNGSIIENECDYFADRETCSYVDRFRKYILSWELELESAMADYLSFDREGKFNKTQLETIRKDHLVYYHHLVSSEIKLASITHQHKICHVGMGAMPISLILLHRATNGCCIDGLDIDTDSVKSATQLLEKVQLDNPHIKADKINFYPINGALYDYTLYDVVILSSSIENKSEIITQVLSSHSHSSICIIDRAILGLARYFYKSSYVSLNDSLKKIAVDSSAHIVSSVLYEG